ncbi:50S ribosomal protein L15 [Desulfatiglans anilini]|uniref:50S ribosomal protein L15 n=1 Tax=Desulfatiglans anilini TaxID=90728 RepID=UPI00047F7FB0|nr:50S ribosomal protein L15 [Desulfatiglans anilini]
MKLNELRPAEGSRKNRKRVGRGPGSGHGKTACRGSKGQRSRSGGGASPGFEGGQMPLQRRLPKRGFKNPFRTEFSVVNLEVLNRFERDATVDVEALQQAGLLRKDRAGVKLLGNGELQHPMVVRVHRVSRSAREKIEAIGGRVEII